jgi:aryl-alcohol dehydrogenase-like predicted oxidoreductase
VPTQTQQNQYRRNEAVPPDSRFADMERNPMLRKRMQEQVFDVTEGLQPLLEAKGCSMSQLALAWCVHQPGITSPIIGPRTMEQFEDNLAALTVTLTESDYTTIGALIPPGRMVSPFYEAEFGPHRYRW